MLIAVYTFILQKSYAHNTLEAAVERNISCSDGMHQVISNKFTREDYAEINDRADMKLERYQELQKSLNELRSLNSTRYLYTAKRDADGRLIYLVDGLDLLAEDNDLNAEIARELLGEEGLVVERADNGVACVELLEKATTT